MLKRLLSSSSSTTATAIKENIGLTGIAQSPNALSDLLAAYKLYMAQLERSTLPDDHLYRTSMKDYTNMAISVLRSENPKALIDKTGMQFEELLIECEEEKDLLEALEKDQ